MKKRTPLIPGLSRRAIAERLTLSPRTIEALEQGRKPITERNRRAIEKVKEEIDRAAGYHPGSKSDPRD